MVGTFSGTLCSQVERIALNGELTAAAASERIAANGGPMRIKIIVWMFAVVTLLGVSSAALAHHGTAAYDTKSTVTVKGTMTDFRFINPHVQLFFDVKNDKGETEKWQAELTAPNKLSRAGWDKHTLKPGDSITATGYVAKDDAHTMWIRELIGPNGEPLHLFEE
jgi:hypothetical protein